MPDPLPAACACPRCGTSLPASTGGLCLRCLGENALRLGGEPPPDSFATSSQLTPTGDATRRADVHQSAPTELGPYEIIEELGRGGMGRVYAARHTQLGTVVALKVIAAGRFATAEEEMRFVREAQTAARLKHPHLVAVHDAGRATGVAYYTMDLVPDGDLAQRLRARPYAPRDAAGLVRKIAGAVAHAHAAGVLHRDLKPSNILLEGDEPRVADFGLAAQLEPGGELTATTRVLGTPHYLAPELAAHGSRAATPASDLYALGAILYELLTGRPPRAGADREPVSPRLLEPSLPRDLETICLKCLAAAPGARYASVSAFADDLGNFLEHRPIAARPVSPLGRFARWCRRRPALAAVWFLVVALAAGSASATFVIRRARDRALVAEYSVRRQLREARLAQAEAVRLTHRAGRRDEALAAVAAAAQVEPDRAARDSAIASLALRDISLVRRWPIQAPAPLMTVFAADGSGYAVQDGPAFAWRETGTDREFGRMTAPAGAKPLGWPTLSRDGRRFAARFSDSVVRVWQRDATGVSVLREFADRPHPWPRPRPVYGRDLEFSPDGTRLALAHRDGGFSVVSLADGAELLRGRDSHPSTRLQFSPDGKVIAASSAQLAAGRKLHLFDAATGALLRSMDLGGNLFDLAWSSDGALVAATTDAAQLRTFRAATGDAVGNVPLPEGNVARLIFAGDDELVLTGAVEQSFRWRRRRSGEELVQLDGVEMSRAWPAGDGRGFFTTDHVGHGQQFRFVEPTGVRSRRVDGVGTTPSFGALGSLAFSRDGRWLAATGTARLAVFRTTDLERVAFGPTVAEGDDTVTVTFAPNGEALLVAGTVSGLQRVPLREAAGTLSLGEATKLLDEKGWQLRGVSPDGRRLALADQAAGRVKILEVDGAGVRGVSQWNVPGAYSAAFDPRGDTLLLNVDHSAPNAAGTALRLWNVADGKELAKLDAPISAEADWDPLGGVAVTSNGEALTVLWRIDAAVGWSRGPALSAEVPQGNTTTLALAPGGKVLAVASAKTVHLVDTATGRSFATLRDEVPFGFVNELVFSPDGARLALLDTEGTVHLWNLPELRGELAKLGLDW